MSDPMRMRIELRQHLEAAEARLRETSDCNEIEYYRALVTAAHTDVLFLCDVYRRVKLEGGFFCY
jgi:hypothetical protein